MTDLPDAARAFADGDVALLPAALSDAEGDALVALLAERGDAARLQRLGEGADKPLAKRARKALHLLKTRGVAVPSAPKREYRPQGPYVVEEPSLASMIDGRGERIVWLVRTGENGFDVYEAQLSDTRGILGFQAAQVARKDWRAHTTRVVADDRLAVGRISERHARQLIEDGYKRTMAAGRVPPEDFARARLGLGHLEPEERHPSLDVAPPLPIGETRHLLAPLHALAELRTWIPPEEALPALDLEIGNIVTSKLIVDPTQRQEQLAAAIVKVANQSLTPEYRALLGERLRETAYLLAQRGRVDAARLASTAAELTLDASVPASDNPFVLRLFDKVVKAPSSSGPPAPEPPSSSLLP
ncbi:MAG: hypothetical protein JWN44_4023 [Myxococcales bacterium]|nr:hypothetical protein [Myxococcales bacterium]